MGDAAMVSEYTDQKQRAAICYSTWDRRKVSKSGKRGRDAFLYLAPRIPFNQFAQCSTCKLYTGIACSIMAQETVPPTASCGFYIPGGINPLLTPLPLVSATEAGLVDREVRCENCISFNNGKCELFARLNNTFPDIFALDEQVDRYGCCNAQEPIS